MKDLPEILEWSLTIIPDDQPNLRYEARERLAMLPPAAAEAAIAHFTKLRSVSEGLTPEQIRSRMDELCAKAGIVGPG